MNIKFKIVGSGKIYEFLNKKVEQIRRDNLLIIAANDLMAVKKYLNQNDEYENILIYSDLMLNDIQSIDNENILFGFVNGDLNKEPLILYGGNRLIFDYIEKISPNVYFYNNKFEAVILNESIAGIHYSYALAYYVGIVLSKKYDLDIKTYFDNLIISTPELCQGAYRNIWKALKDNNSYEDIDDVIHGMEMLVCKMKKTKGKEMIFDNQKRQIYLNKLLASYWKNISCEDKRCQ